jgi:hypothetical protein
VSMPPQAVDKDILLYKFFSSESASREGSQPRWSNYQIDIFIAHHVQVVGCVGYLRAVIIERRQAEV